MPLLRLFAVDPSLTCSGWALFDLGDGVLEGVGKIKSMSAKHGLSNRLVDLQDKVERLFSQLELDNNDVIICEAPTTMRDPRAAFRVEQVRGIFETVGRMRGLRVPGRLNPRTVQFEVMGLRGKQRPRAEVKEIAACVVKTLYGEQLADLGFKTEPQDLKRHQDIVDAILVGSLGVTRIQSAGRTETPLEDVFEGARQRVTKRAIS